MKKWMLRIVFGIIALVLLLTGGIYGYLQYAGWSAQNKRDARADAIATYYPSKARVTVYSLESRKAKEERDDTFHGYPIRGSVEITEPDEKAALILSLSRAASHGKYSAMCFDPHHGLRIVEEGKMIDFVICFSCMSVQPYHFNNETMYASAGFPIAVYNSILKRHGLPVHELKKSD